MGLKFKSGVNVFAFLLVAIPIFLAIAAVVLLIYTFIFVWAWNAAVVPVILNPHLTYWVAFRLVLFIALVFSPLIISSAKSK